MTDKKTTETEKQTAKKKYQYLRNIATKNFETHKGEVVELSDKEFNDMIKEVSVYKKFSATGSRIKGL